MKKKFWLAMLLTLVLTVLITSCTLGDKAIVSMKVVDGTLTREYALGATADFSSLELDVTYNDGTTTRVSGADITVSNLDTTTPGTKSLTIVYDGFSILVDVTVKGNAQGGGQGEITLSGISILSDSIKTKIKVGETLDTSALKLSATYSNNSVGTISAGFEVGTIDTTTAGVKELTVTYNGKTAKIDITVVGVASISVISGGNIEIDAGETLDLSGVIVQATNTDDTKEIVPFADLTFGQVDNTTAGTKGLTVTYEGKTATINVTVVGIASIAVIAGGNLEVTEGDELDLSGIIVQATKTNNATFNVPSADLTFGQVDTDTVGTKELTITYAGVSTTVNVLVKEAAAPIGFIVNASSLGNLTTVEDGVALDLDAIREAIAVEIKYGFTNGTVSHYAPLTDKSLLDLEDATIEGVRYLVVGYADFDDVQIPVSETAPVLESIEIVAATFNNKVIIGKTYNPGEFTITLNYSNNTHETKVISASYTNYQDIDTTVAGAKTLTVTYEGKTCQAQVYVMGATSIALTSTPVLKTKIGDALAIPAMQILVNYGYNEGGVNLSATEIVDVTADMYQLPDTNVAGAHTINITYAGQTCEIKAYVLGIVSIALSQTPELKTQLDKALQIPAMQLLVTYGYNEGGVNLSETVTVDVTANMYATPDVSAAGNKSFTITYAGQTCQVAYTVAGIASVSIKNGTLETDIFAGNSIDYTGLVVIVTYTDGTSEEVAYAGNADFFTIDETAINFTTSGYYDLSISYKGVAGTVKVQVSEIEIEGVLLPESLSVTRESNKKKFLDQDRPYFVGNYNPFKFSLRLQSYDDEDNEKFISEYVSASQVFLLGENGSETLVGDEYVIIDENANTFHFTAAAAGKSFKISTRPAYGVAAENVQRWTKSINVTVVDGAYNVHRVKELHQITNSISDLYLADGITTDTQTNIIKKYLANDGIEYVGDKISGVVLHDDFSVTMDVLPQEYLVRDQAVDKNGKLLFDNYGQPIYIYTIHDTMSIFERMLGGATNGVAQSKTFNFYGNYYQINSYNVPQVNAAEAADDNDMSHSQLFRFINGTAEYNYTPVREGTFDYTQFKLNVNDLFIYDDDKNDPQNADSVRSKYGLIGFKIGPMIANVTNTVAERYYTTLIAEYDYLDITLDKVYFYNSWQNHIFLFGSNKYQDDNSQPVATHKPIVMQIKDSKVMNCGGPVIISQVSHPNFACDAKSGPEVYVDTDSELWAYVNSSSIWFDAMGQQPAAALIESLNDAFTIYGKSFRVHNPNPMPGIQFTGYYMNLIYLSMAGGANPFDTSVKDVDGKFVVGDKPIMDMNDTIPLFDMAGNTIPDTGFGSMGVSALKSKTDIVGSMLGKAIPVFESSEGGVAWYGADPETGDIFLASDFDFASQKPTVIEDPTHSVFEGNYISMYYMTMGAVFGDYGAWSGSN